jgi:hypothetical protein
MIIDDLDFIRISVRPAKADAPLVINSNATLPQPITAQFLQPIPRRGAKIIESLSRVYQQELPKGYSL